jgi:ketosteroid isomerase-like protein
VNTQELVRATIAGWNERGIEGLLEYAAPDVVWHGPPEYLDGQEWRGREVLTKAWHKQFDSVFEEVHSDLEALELGPERYCAALHLHGRAHASGIVLDWHSYFVGRIEEGLIKEVWVFTDRAEARTTAGLEPE